jgi:hypothetical protein
VAPKCVQSPQQLLVPTLLLPLMQLMQQRERSPPREEALEARQWARGDSAALAW